MKILHITIGNPNDHQGGLNRYCLELMQYQKEQGNETILLYPSSTGKHIKHITIKKDADGFWKICGALPTAITYGIDEPCRYMKPVDKGVYLGWLDKIKPDVVHIHSIQGIHLELFEAIKDYGIPSVYTTHDFYPICVRSLLLDFSGNRCSGPESKKCAYCNQHAGLSPQVQAIRQSYFYKVIKRYLKKTKVFSNYVKKRGRDVYTSCAESRSKKEVSLESCVEFSRLIAYNHKIMETVTILHCNSPHTQQIYAKFYPGLDSCCIPVTHQGMKRIHHEQTGVIKFAYMGGTGIPKGYEVLQKAISLMKQNVAKDWEIYFYGGNFNEKSEDLRLHYMGYFSVREENSVWDNIDVLIVPSISHETYGFTVVEGLCHGIPVIVSDTVGSGYLINEISDKLVFPSGDFKQLFSAMKYIMRKENYKMIASKISSMKLPISLSEHGIQIQQIYEKIMREKNADD